MGVFCFGVFCRLEVRCQRGGRRLAFSGLFFMPVSLATRHIWSLIEIRCRNYRGVGPY